MIREIFHKVLSVSMAILVLFSTLSFSVEKHYCGDKLVDMSLFSEAETCGMEASDIDHKTTSDIPGEEKQIKTSPCCQDVIDRIEGQDELSLEKTTKLDTSQKVFVLAFVAVFSGFFELDQQPQPDLKQYSPPEYHRDIHVLNEVFLI